jgi:hypothetical protein
MKSADGSALFFHAGSAESLDVSEKRTTDEHGYH